jgi:hypothetical protein
MLMPDPPDSLGTSFNLGKPSMHHALGIGWHQLAVAVEYFAVRADNNYAVVERAGSLLPVAFIDAVHDRHGVNSGGLAHFAAVAFAMTNSTQACSCGTCADS